jgi:hypothetical protein
MRSTLARSSRTASRLRDRSGISAAIGVLASCASVDDAACTGFTRMSK